MSYDKSISGDGVTRSMSAHADTQPVSMPYPAIPDGPIGSLRVKPNASSLIGGYGADLQPIWMSI